MTEPISLIQTNLRETDSDLDPRALVAAVKQFPANTLLFSVGGITAHYPTAIEHHYRSEYLPADRDLVGAVVAEAHWAKVRVIGRFDFSRVRQAAYQAHPEWFYTRRDGGPVFDDNGLYNVCINGGYYHQKAIEILTEAMERYPLDGLFFNWFGNVRWDYHGRPIGLCHCAACEALFQKTHGRPVPEEPDKEYNEFIHQCAAKVARKFRDLIRRKLPRALFMTYIDEYTDGIVTEADFYKPRPLPQWIYAGSEPVNRNRNTRPDALAIDLVMPYQEMPYRFASIAGPGLRALLYQNLAHGAFPAFVLLGGWDQPDRTGLKAVQPVFQFYAKHSAAYVGQQSAARTILYGRQDRSWGQESADYRGFFRLLTELHLPFKVTNKVDGLNARDIDLVIVPEGPTPEVLQPYLENGGAVLVAGIVHPGLTLNKTVKLWENTTSSYMRIEDHAIFPSLKDTWTIFWEGSYLELEPSPTPVTLIPPGPFGPPDKVDTLKQRTDKPGLVLKEIGKGRLAYIPWQVGRLYYRFGNDKHRLFVSDLIDHLLPGHQRQLVTNAHPSVEMTVMRQGGRTLIHLVNLSGHAGTTFFEAVEMRDISIAVQGKFSRAALLDGQPLKLDMSGGYARFTIPALQEYLVVCLHK